MHVCEAERGGCTERLEALRKENSRGLILKIPENPGRTEGKGSEVTLRFGAWVCETLIHVPLVVGSVPGKGLRAEEDRVPAPGQSAPALARGCSCFVV